MTKTLIEEKISKYTTMLKHNQEIYERYAPFDDSKCNERTAALTTVRLCECLIEELEELQKEYDYV